MIYKQIWLYLIFYSSLVLLERDAPLFGEEPNIVGFIDLDIEMAGERGFEPLLYGPEPHVLPLDDSPLKN